MSTEQSTDSNSETSERRAGYLVGAGVNALLLWMSYQLLDWGWPGFLTQEFDDLLPLITFSFTVSIVGYLVLFVSATSGRPKQLFDALTAGIGAVVLIRFLQVEPFDFSGYDIDWTLVVRFVLVVALIGSILGFVISSVRLITWRTDDDVEPPGWQHDRSNVRPGPGPDSQSEAAEASDSVSPPAA